MTHNNGSVPATPGQHGERSLESGDIVIIGNGIAGLTAAVEARHHAPDKRIVIITDQLHPTINTPSLKQFAIGKLDRDQLLAYPTGTEQTERIHVIHAHVEEIHAQSKYLALDGKRFFGYGSLLLATGNQPQGLPAEIPGRAFDGVMMLHRLQDYLDFRRRLPEVREAVVIGGGAHANETVMGLLHWGVRVHWLIRSKTFMGRILDSTASEMVLESARKAGALVHTETEVKGIIGRMGGVTGVITNHHQMVPCQLVLSCTGTSPVLTLARYCTIPLLHENGILVDDKLRTSVQDIYAAGDVAALLNPQTGKYETRAQWYSAVNMGRIAGAMMAGNEDAAQHPFGAHWHATHLGELSMLTVGEPISQTRGVNVLTDTSSSGYRRITLAGDRLIGYLSLGTKQPDSLAIKQIIDEGYSVNGMTRDLLKGTFDARSFLSKLSSRTAQGILKGRRPLPAPATASAHPPQVHRLPDTGPFVQPAGGLQRQTGPLRLPLSVRQGTRSQVSLKQEQRVLYEEEPGAFNGNRPLPSQNATANGRRVNNPITPPISWQVDKINPFSGKVPAPEETNQHASNQSRLWEYADPDRK